MVQRPGRSAYFRYCTKSAILPRSGVVCAPLATDVAVCHVEDVATDNGKRSDDDECARAGVG